MGLSDDFQPFNSPPNMRTMDALWFALIWVAIGLAAGWLTAFVVFWARRHFQAQIDLQQPSVPEPAQAVLAELDVFAVVLDRSLSVVYANEEATRVETIPAELMTTELFVERARAVLRSGESFFQDPEDSDADGIRLLMFRLGFDFVVVLAEDRGEELRLNAMRRDFIANMSHELKTPVASLGLLAEAIREARADPERVAGFAETMVSESRRLAELTNDIILLSEAQAEPRVEDLVTVDMVDVVEREIQEVQAFAIQRDVDIAFKCVLADEQRALTVGRKQALGVAVANLLTNAIKHAPADSRVGVALDADKDWIFVRVTDHGSGIAPADIERIFERFYRVDDARSRADGGTGLGLSIVRHTMLSHGGSVNVWSKPGVGSTFTLQIPVLGTEGTADKLLAKRAKKKKRNK